MAYWIRPPKKQVTFAPGSITPAEVMETFELCDLFLQQYGPRAFEEMVRLERDYIRLLEHKTNHFDTDPPLWQLEKEYHERKLAFFRLLVYESCL